ncbi:MAG: hypothetical protein BMS9Abin28_1220 [Anaerolineae bacterium]|nr:MAG: hypothetical protein BMS9Abin28_1220 [Anaerolineae bacterium]
MGPMELIVHLTSVDKLSPMRTLARARMFGTLIVVLLALSILLAASAAQILDRQDQVQRFTRPLEFDYLTWTARALGKKLGQFGLGAPGFLTNEARNRVVLDYLELIRESVRLRGDLERTLSDPNLPEPQLAAQPISDELEQVRERLEALKPLAETVLQENVAVVLEENGLGAGGSPFPPVAFQISELPVALIVSPRDAIRQDANLQLDPGLNLEDQIDLEAKIEDELDVSALVVGIGGLSTYPTMIMESTSIEWLTETIVHEWAHLYLAFRPLGFRYDQSPETRTINETVAGIVGREIGREVLARYYPEFLPDPPPEPGPTSEIGPTLEPPAFDFRAEMRETRIRVDELLAEGSIEEAEEYMEARRQVFWDHGYRNIRRINQAYFAFYGAYADSPRGEAGEDPIGEAVRAVWDQIADPAEFLRKMAWLTSLEQVQALLES